MNKVDFETMIAGVSLYRPGPMQFIPEYQARANGMKDVEYPCKELEEITKSSYGIAVYQEQVMKMTQILGGYSAGAADSFRKAIGKKSKKVMEVELPKLKQSIIDNGFSEHIAKHVVDIIEPFVGYGLTGPSM